MTAIKDHRPVSRGTGFVPDDSSTAPAPRNRRGRGSRRGRFSFAPVVLLAPAGLLLAFVLGYPIIELIVSSFQDFGLRSLFVGGTSWVGLANYVQVFTDPQFIPVLLRTFIFTGLVVVGCVVVGMAMSQVMMRTGKALRVVLSVVLILAWAIPTVTSTLIWQWLFQPTYGVVNWFITSLHAFGDFSTYNWISKPASAFLIIGILILWQSVPFIALTLYAGQSQIPAEYYEAAMLDGASGWRIYRSVTLPFLRPILYLVTILSIIWHFNTFNQIWLLTQGGPDQGTTTLGIWSFQKAFAASDFGQGSAIAVVTAAILIVITAFYVRRLIRTGEAL